MAEFNLNLKQITDKLNAEFAGEERKIIFWYDDNAEFADEIDSLELENAKIYRLEQDKQFYTKYFLEKVDTETSYLLYAPYPMPDKQENHLLDMIYYSKQFFVDRASLICADLGIDD
ncbi:MAG: BREX-1 system phosphatase PglZ type A, partial [Ruminococcus flavefaciens]|nr:BREX-1 system phosphatase PglZ type A [Ruminococcus flavefaciens]